MIKVREFLKKSYPQNVIIRKPVLGALIISVFTFAFVVIYKPLEAHASIAESIEMTMAVYALIAGVSIYVMILALKGLGFFSREEDWTVLKELLSAIVLLLGLGVAVYLAAFLVEPPAQRWNLRTFIDSLKSAVLVGILPFTLFSAINYPYLFLNSTDLKRPKEGKDKSHALHENRVRIESQLKKESLSFFPSQFVYAESDGNYVAFHLSEDGTTRKVTIRNTISNIEQQLEHLPEIIRCHRAFLVNLSQVTKKSGNTSGYRLQLNGTDNEIPVSRQNISAFDKAFSA